MDLINDIIERAKANPQRIVLPEGDEERTLRAADRALAEKVADIILLGDHDKIMATAKDCWLPNIGKANIINPATSPKREEYANLLYELRKICQPPL